MASQQTSGDLISNRYASALYEISSDNKIVDNILEDLNLIQSVLNSSKELQSLVKSPLIASNDKLQVLLKIISNKNINPLSIKFLNIISQNKRFAKLSSIIIQFIDINTKKRGEVIADVTSADNLTEDQRQNINTQLKNIIGDKLSLNFNVDKNIMGGLIVKVGSKMIDTSLANKINKLKIAMKGA